jgi:hypothetical protein
MNRFWITLAFLSLMWISRPLPLWSQDADAGMVKPTRGIIENVPEQEPFWGQAIVRGGPGGDFPKLGSLPNGTEVTLGQSFGFFIQITSPLEGFIGSNLVRITETAPADVDPNSPPSFDLVIFNSRPEKRREILETPKEKPFVPVPKTLPPEPPVLAPYFEKK